MTTRRNAGISPRSRLLSRSRSSSARSPRKEQQTQPFPRTTVRSSTRRNRWWSSATSPSSLTITAVSPISGWGSKRERSVVFALPRKPVSSATGVYELSGKGAEEIGVERVERPPGERSRLRPEDAEVVDDHSTTLGVAKDVDAAGPIVEGQPEVLEHAVYEPDAQRTTAPAPVLLGPVVAEQDTTERTH